MRSVASHGEDRVVVVVVVVWARVLGDAMMEWDAHQHDITTQSGS